TVSGISAAPVKLAFLATLTVKGAVEEVTVYFIPFAVKSCAIPKKGIKIRNNYFLMFFVFNYCIMIVFVALPWFVITSTK
uniref:hypothetical protein n=1 Tax=Flavobacterium psychrophilum TaxID=96345 RepID=UPI00141A870F